MLTGFPGGGDGVDGAFRHTTVPAPEPFGHRGRTCPYPLGQRTELPGQPCRAADRSPTPPHRHRRSRPPSTSSAVCIPPTNLHSSYVYVGRCRGGRAQARAAGREPAAAYITRCRRARCSSAAGVALLVTYGGAVPHADVTAASGYRLIGERLRPSLQPQSTVARNAFTCFHPGRLW